MSKAPARYAVVGNPIGHSKSPLIHSLFARQTGAEISYVKELVSEQHFAAFAETFFRNGGAGLNVTVPFKQRAFALCDRLSGNAARSGAVNTLYQSDGSLAGANTDGIGLVRDIRDNLAYGIRDRRILLLGAGGAVRGILPALENESPARMTVWNRTAERAAELARAFDGSLAAASLEALRGEQFDLIINGTSGSLQGHLPPVDAAWLAPGCCAYDMVYADEETVFLRWAREAGAGLASDGLGMLVEQAAESFHIWRGVRPETGPVIGRLRAGQ